MDVEDIERQYLVKDSEKRLILSLPGREREKILAIGADMAKRAGRTLSASAIVCTCLGIVAKMCGSPRTYLLRQEQITKLIADLAKQIPPLAAEIAGDLTGRTVTVKTSPEGVSTFFIESADGAEPQSVVRPATLPSLDAYGMD